MKKFIKKILKKSGYAVYKITDKNNSYINFNLSKTEKEIIDYVNPYSMTSVERLLALIEATKYISRNCLNGSIVECGVYKGGSIMAIAQVLAKLNDFQRNIYLFDILEGMPEPSIKDFDYNGRIAVKTNN